MAGSVSPNPQNDLPREEAKSAPRRFGRRRLVKGLAATGALAAVGGSLLYRAAFSRGTPVPGFRTITPAELTTLVAMAEIYLPGKDGLPKPEEVDAYRLFDAYVAGLPERLSRLMKLAIRAIEWGSVVESSEVSRFSKASISTREAILDAWESSGLEARRAAVFSIKWGLSMGYFEHPKVRQAMGWYYPCAGITPPAEEWL